MLERLANFIARRRRAVLVASVIVVALAGAFGGPVVGLLDSGDDFEDSTSENVRATEAVNRATGRSASPDLVVLVRLGAPATDPAAQAKVRRVAEALRDRDVAEVLALRGDRPAALVSRDGRSTYLVATFRTGVDDEELVERIEARLAGEPGVTLGGGVIAETQVGEQVQEDLARAELLAFPILFLLSLLVFRGVVAALLPLAVGMAAILVTFLLMRLANAVEPMSVFAINLITGLGLGLAIDYSLFMVSRFREELERRGDRTEALRATLRTAGRTVLFSAITVAAAMAALIVFPQRFLFSMGVGGMLVSLSAAAVALTLLPALLFALGPRVNALSPRRWRVALREDAAEVRRGPWYRLSQFVMRRPAPIAVAAAVLLIVIGLPFLRIEFTGVDASVLPEQRSARWWTTRCVPSSRPAPRSR
jgi:RND superfamily putative drug exporter